MTTTTKTKTSQCQACNTCTHSASSPYRVTDDAGRVIQGCIDAFHTGHLVPGSESERWHNRKEAMALREMCAKVYGWTTGGAS